MGTLESNELQGERPVSASPVKNNVSSMAPPHLTLDDLTRTASRMRGRDYSKQSILHRLHELRIRPDDNNLYTDADGQRLMASLDHKDIGTRVVKARPIEHTVTDRTEFHVEAGESHTVTATRPGMWKFIPLFVDPKKMSINRKK